nr:helix-turn-helix transcriptional regulator [uncultured Catonella sp.]
MKELTIGNLIEYQIKKKSVSIDKLVEGLCSTTSLKRLINGDTRQSFFLVERILERLGVSVNKVSLLHNENDDRLFIMREMISKLLADRAYTKAEFILTEYKEIADLSNPLQLQYVIEAEGVIQLECYEKHEEALELFNKAQKIILGKFEMDKLHEFVLGEEEIILLMLILNEEMKVKNKNISIYARQLLDYVEKQFEDEEVKTNIYTKLAWILGESAIRNKKYEDALEFTLNGINALTDNGLLLHLPQFLDRLLFLTKDRDENMYRSWKRKRDALKELYLEYNEPWETEDIRLWESYRQNSVYLISEFLKDERDLAEYTQEELAEAVGIDIKTISRIENGKSTPKKGTFTYIKEHFDIEIESFQTRLTVDNLSLLEMERDISRLSSKHRYEEAESLFKSLKKQLSMESRINRQYVAFMEELFDSVFKRKTTEEVLANLEKAFLITRTDKHLENLGRFVTTDLEAKIVNMMAICYEKLGDRNKSIKLLEKLKEGYEKSSVTKRYHRILLGLLYINLCTYHEEINRFKDAINMADKAIKYYIRCNRGDNLGFLVEEKTYIIDRMTNDNSKSNLKYIQSFRLMELMKASENEKAPLREAYKTWYGEDIERD